MSKRAHQLHRNVINVTRLVKNIVLKNELEKYSVNPRYFCPFFLLVHIHINTSHFPAHSLWTQCFRNIFQSAKMITRNDEMLRDVQWVQRTRLRNKVRQERHYRVVCLHFYTSSSRWVSFIHHLIPEQSLFLSYDTHKSRLLNRTKRGTWIQDAASSALQRSVVDWQQPCAGIPISEGRTHNCCSRWEGCEEAASTSGKHRGITSTFENMQTSGPPEKMQPHS